MGDETQPLDAMLDDLERTLEDIERTLQEFGEVVNMVEDAESQGFDSSEQTVADLINFVNENMDADEEDLAELQDAADAFLQTVEASSLDAVSAEAMRDWADEAGGEDAEGDAPEDGEGGEESTGTEGEEGATMEELEQVKDVVGTVADHMGDIKDMLQAREAKVDKLDRRLSEMESEPAQRSLAGERPAEHITENGDGSEEDAPDPSPML